MKIEAFERSVDLFLTRSDIERQQDGRMLHDAEVVARISILDEKTGKHVWFSVTPVITAGQPAIEIRSTYGNNVTFGRFEKRT